MKNTETQIFEKAKIILQDLNPNYFNENDILKITFSEKDKVARPIGKIIDIWLVSIRSLFDNVDFLTISDETGEPLYYQNFNIAIAEIEKNAQGRYVTKK